jgi:copper homeostasis protein CutC
MKVIVIGKVPEILSRVSAVIGQAGHDVLPTREAEEAAEWLRTSGAHAIIIGGGVDAEPRAALKQIAESNDIHVVEGNLSGHDPEEYARDVYVARLSEIAH